MKLILASASPRRTQLLSQVGLEHIIIPSECEEVITKEEPEAVVMELSEEKAENVFQTYMTEHKNDEFMVLGSDTVVAIHHQILGKPEDEADAVRMIRMIQNNIHQVYTGVTICAWKDGNKTKKTFYECSQVQVYPMTTGEIERYVATKEPMDKAGAYGIQGAFAAYIKGIEGDYNNIVGLPIAKIYHEIKELTNTI